jgi:hypothetical protein
MKVTRTRTFLPLKVGDSQLVEVLLHMRTHDMAWFNNNDNNNNESLFAELLHLIQEQILPRMFADELDEENHHGHRRPPPLVGPGGLVIEHQPKKMDCCWNNNKKRKQQRNQRLTKKALAEQQRMQEKADMDNQKRKRDVYYAFGKEVQLAYRLQQDTSRPAETLLLGSSAYTTTSKNGSAAPHGEASSERATFRPLKRLSKRILVWCYPLVDDGDDRQSATDPDPPNGGFPRPEFIPISELFRAPASDI